MNWGWQNVDEFGYEKNDEWRSDLLAITSATGWWSCSRYSDDGEWFFQALPQFVTIVRTHIPSGETRYVMFGVTDFFGQLKREDMGTQFMGYAHESEFVVPGRVLSEAAKERMEDGEFMCGDPSRHLNSEGRLTA